MEQSDVTLLLRVYFGRGSAKEGLEPTLEQVARRWMGV